MKNFIFFCCLLLAAGNASAQQQNVIPVNTCQEYIRTVASGHIKLADFEISDQNQNTIHLTLRSNKNEFVWFIKLPSLGYCIKSSDRVYFTFEGGQSYSAIMLDPINCKGEITYELKNKENKALLNAFLTKRFTHLRIYSEHKSFLSTVSIPTGNRILDVFNCLR